MGVIPNPKMAFIFPISCILALIFPILIKYFPKCVEKGSFPKSQIKSLVLHVIPINQFIVFIWRPSFKVLYPNQELSAERARKKTFEHQIRLPKYGLRGLEKPCIFSQFLFYFSELN